MQALQQQDFKSLIDNHPRAIMLATPEPRITYVNRMFRSVTGYQADDVVGKPPSVLSSGLHSAQFYRSMWEGLSQRGRWEGLIWNRRKNGEVYPQWLSIYPVDFAGTRMFAGVFMDIGELTENDERLASLAYYDPLTELPNRALFKEFLKARVSQKETTRRGFAVLFVDLDFFKSINDLYGHECGDRVLQEAAQCVRSVLREGDVVARLSGDEFAAIVELNGQDTPDSICQRMVRIFQAPVVVDQREYFLSASVGAALFPDHGRTGPELLQNADRAMYSAKLAGRACYRMYSAVDSEQGRRHQRLSEALVASLKTAPEEFSVVFQPQLNLESGQVVGYEALLRWCHPEFGSVSPADFVPIAENRGHIHELTEHLIRCVMRDLPTALVPGIDEGCRVAINISARQINDSRLEVVLAPFFDRLKGLGWQPELEITETHMMNLSPRCLQRLSSFRERGVAVAIDDFGTGYSSLAYLHTLPVQVLKIDRQFTQRLGENSRDSRIVSAILGIADALEMEVVAEGIETAAQLEKLRELGCMRGQGFLLGRPAELKSLLPINN
ncbi:sensory box sensor/GGDEF/EAL domain protein [Marinobacter santoriniensis NKSG1]|uniref:Sensory box sensor/GGDEF/EAL domain protein n=1 Tax=Marinobacter santoriniensis NKSG1 TaxID=1288826 RepID=M7CPG5_9GAMM|nr:EAL domain-containing protein [Marinobacter santoriniensis]EMP55069.1 sensory box sensor/GGDEF/EAL domain protein [Marinobacter santoriniensis NKSG1]